MIRRYRKRVATIAAKPSLGGFVVREYRNETDQDAWIRIHQQAFGHRLPWTKDRFTREFIERAWWNPDRMLFAEGHNEPKTIGTVTLGETSAGDPTIGTVSWLAVTPEYQRREIGRLLMAHLECMANGLGYRWLYLETLDAWNAANRFYAKHGWEPLHE